MVLQGGLVLGVVCLYFAIAVIGLGHKRLAVLTRILVSLLVDI